MQTNSVQSFTVNIEEQERGGLHLSVGLVIAELASRVNVVQKARLAVEEQTSDVDHIARLYLVLLALLIMNTGLWCYTLCHHDN